jgi:hypothetical protein
VYSLQTQKYVKDLKLSWRINTLSVSIIRVIHYNNPEEGDGGDLRNFGV